MGDLGPVQPRCASSEWSSAFGDTATTNRYLWSRHGTSVEILVDRRTRWSAHNVLSTVGVLDDHGHLDTWYSQRNYHNNSAQGRT